MLLNKTNNALARSYVYKLLSIIFSAPELLEAELEGNRLITQLNECSSELVDYGLANTVGALENECRGNIIEDIKKHHFKLFFQGNKNGFSLYEMSYHKGPLFLNAGKLADIAGFYNAFGLEVSDNNRDRVDHISLELEFLYFLALKEAYALKNDDADKVDICRSAQVKFLEDHLGKWTGPFLEELLKCTDFGFYIKAAEFIDQFVKTDLYAMAGK